MYLNFEFINSFILQYYINIIKEKNYYIDIE